MAAHSARRTPEKKMTKYDYSLNAYKSSPKHEIVDADTRRQIARVHHEEDLHMILAALRAVEEAKR